MKQESTLKSRFMAEAKKHLGGYVALRHEDVRTNGIPDLSVTGHGMTTWWEFKHATPHFEGRGIQELTMLRLAAVGYARYIVWHEEKDGTKKRTLIVHPQMIKNLEPEVECSGFDMRFIVEYIRKVHGA